MIRENYGRSSKLICNNGPITNLNCVSKDQNAVKDACSNEPSCSIAATNNIFGDPCSGTTKYLEVEYECVSCEF